MIYKEYIMTSALHLYRSVDKWARVQWLYKGNNASSSEFESLFYVFYIQDSAKQNEI